MFRLGYRDLTRVLSPVRTICTVLIAFEYKCADRKAKKGECLSLTTSRLLPLVSNLFDELIEPPVSFSYRLEERTRPSFVVPGVVYISPTRAYGAITIDG